MKKADISAATKQRLADALKQQMQKKPLNKITVRELLDMTDITRSTFYYHFTDIYDLMKWMFDTELMELLKKSESFTSWDNGLLLALRYVEQNRKVCLCAYNSVGLGVLQQLFYKNVVSIMQRFVASLTADIPAHPEHVEFIVQYYTGALVMMLLRWIMHPDGHTPEEMIALLDVAMYGNIRAALERSAQGRALASNDTTNTAKVFDI